MNREQFDRWLDFATRMAETCFSDSRRPSADWVAEQAEEFILNYQNCYRNVRGWDGCNKGIYVCDDMTKWSTDSMPGFRWTIENQLQRQRDALIDRICAEREDANYRALVDVLSEEIESVLDKKVHLAEAQWAAQWAAPVEWCVRAGLGLALGERGMVIGFTAGDIRLMYPEGVPAWITSQFNEFPALAPDAMVAL